MENIIIFLMTQYYKIIIIFVKLNIKHEDKSCHILSQTYKKHYKLLNIIHYKK